MLTDRGRFALALGGAVYLAGWAFGSRALYPIAIGLVLAVLAAVAWVRVTARPVRLRRSVEGGEHTAGDDVPVQLKLEVEGRVVPRTLTVEERIEGLGTRAVEVRRRGDRLVGRYVLESVPRGRYPIEGAEVSIEDPFALERREIALDAPGALLVYPRIVDLDILFSETGSRMQEGRRLLMRRPSGFDLHSVREYEQGESLVVLDADAAFDVGTPPDSSFELAVSAAGSILRAHAGRGRRAGLVVNGRESRYQPVHSLDGDWGLALELLASARAEGRNPVAALLVEGAGMPSKALELCVVTSGVSPRLADRLLQRAVTRRATSLVYVDPVSFSPRSGDIPSDVRLQLSRLDHAGIPVCVLRRGDDLAARLGPGMFATEAVG